ncbi:hypothetical protein LguiA_014230 [Lonicera macranthoides]
MSVNEKKEKPSYAHSLGNKLKSQQVGKACVIDTLATAMVKSLEFKFNGEIVRVLSGVEQGLASRGFAWVLSVSIWLRRGRSHSGCV